MFDLKLNQLPFLSVSMFREQAGRRMDWQQPLDERKQVRLDFCLTLPNIPAVNPPVSLLRGKEQLRLFDLSFSYMLWAMTSILQRMAEYNMKSSAAQSGCCDVLLLISINFLTLQNLDMQKSPKFSWP